MSYKGSKTRLYKGVCHDISEIFTPEKTEKHWNEQPDLMAFLKAL